MIDREELENASEKLGVPLADVQRDYVFGWLIAGIFEESVLGASLALKGGNSLRKGYFPATRYSDDLDFSTPGHLGTETLVDEFNAVTRFVSARTGVQFDTDRTKVEVVRLDDVRVSAKLRLYFQDFSGAIGEVVLKVRVDVTEYERLVLPTTRRQLIHQYSDASQCRTDIVCVALEENIADKLKCLLQRRHSHDLFDLIYAVLVNRDVDVDRRAVLSAFLRKTIFEPSPGSAVALLLAAPLEGMRRFWDRIVCPNASQIPFDVAVTRTRDVLDLLFGSTAGVSVARNYFPAGLRNPIIEAGSERKVLALTYDNVPRLVEPYSLSFLRRKDGVAREYFAGFDLTGGRRSGAGMKLFVPEKVQRLEVTSDTFEPRYEISLAKAGDRGAGGELARPFRTGSRSGSSRVVSPQTRSIALYVVECPYCDRRFPRVRRSVVLNKHQDGYGNACYGRRGYLVDEL